MNKYLFRGKRIDDGEWAYGDLLTNGVDFECAIRVHEANENNSSDVVAVVPDTVGQYIGRTDTNGKKLIKVDKYFPSSQLCSCCGYRNQSLTLADRQWQCPQCNTLHNRDINAARNILVEGLKVI